MNKQFAAILLLRIYLLLLASLVFGQNVKKKQVEAVRVAIPPNIDAVLDDNCWNKTKPATDFIQVRPYNGNPASFNSEVRLVYDDEAIYIGAMMFDPYPDSIFTELSERDEISMVDYFGIYIDCYNDYLTAFGFIVTATGVQVDLKSTQSNRNDESWDGVWESKVKIVKNGWIAELKIPYSALRFPRKDIHIWGLQIFRDIKRYRENTSWNFINLEVDGLNNQAGELHGIKNIKPPLRLSFVPYVSGYLQKSPETIKWGYSYNYGLDLKLGLNESYTLDMTLIPDFGQVQSDDEIYNLSPFEVYYSERRPFFMEGTELFNKGNVFYSRRVGKQPSGYYSVEDSLKEDEKISENPQNAQLINATKISGKSSKNLAVGFFNAMTANTWAEATEITTGASRRIKTEPFTNYNMLVFDQALKNNSYVSLFNTNTYQPDLSYSANVTGSELKLANKKNIWSVWSQGIVSQKYNKNITSEFGYLYAIEAGKISGNFTFELSHKVVDDKYDPNDMGFQRHNNYISDAISFSYNIYKPTWIVLDWYNSLWMKYSRLFKPREYNKFTLGGRTRTRFRNHLSVWLNINSSPVDWYDYYEPRIEGRFFKEAPYIDMNVGVSPDYRKRFLVDWRVGGSQSAINNKYAYRFSLAPRFRVNDHLMLVYKFEYDNNRNDQGYVYDSLNAQNQDVIIFGNRNIDTYENKLEADYRLNNKSSINLRLRHYWITINYTEYFELNKDGTLQPSDYYNLHDIGFNAFNLDMAFIWNFAPGSEMRVVWKNAIYTDEEDEVVNSVLHKIEKNFTKNLSNTLNSPATNSFSIKLLYYFDYHNIRQKIKK